MLSGVPKVCHLDKRDTGTSAVSNQRIGTTDSKGTLSLIYIVWLIDN